MRPILPTMVTAILSMVLAMQPAHAMSDKDKKAAAIAAIAILGVAALAHGKHHYQQGYEPDDGDSMADFERGYRDGVHGYAYAEYGSSRDYAQGYEAGDHEREISMAHRRVAVDGRAPPMANQGCAQIVAQNFAVGMHQVHLIKARSPTKHE